MYVQAGQLALRRLDLLCASIGIMTTWLIARFREEHADHPHINAGLKRHWHPAFGPDILTLLLDKAPVVLQDRNFQDNAEFFQNCFEAGRRFKIMNPDRMRSEYGKLVYLLMDSSDDHVQNLLEFKCVRPLRTVYTLLEECNGLAVLQDPLVEAATAEIVAGEQFKWLLHCCSKAVQVCCCQHLASMPDLFVCQVVFMHGQLL